MSKAKYKIGTRGSKLALAQTQQVVDLLHSFEPGAEFIIEIIRTRGEDDHKSTLPEIGGKGVFTAELEESLLKGHIDLAIHSAKDLPTEIHDGLTLAAFPLRVDPRDTLISRDHQKLTALRENAIIGTSSPRRQSQLSLIRPDFKFINLRGNLDTRLHKVRSGECDATVVAAAGLIRLGLLSEASEIFSPDLILPPAGQGALAIECRHDDMRTFKLIELVNHEPTARCVMAERLVLKELQAGCSCPIGVLAGFIQNEHDHERKMRLRAIVFKPETGNVFRAEKIDSPNHWSRLAEHIAKELKECLN